MACITFELPVATKNPTNQRKHPMTRHRRAKGQRDATHLLWPGWSGPALLVVRLTRMAPRRIDSDDNLPAALKSLRDEAARQFRVDDASPLVRWVYAQAPGAPSVLVELSWRRLRWPRRYTPTTPWPRCRRCRPHPCLRAKSARSRRRRPRAHHTTPQVRAATTGTCRTYE
ncbi:hypothetical protein NR798_19330 [Archangium gephyra]|uniref:hypothetical protein n=1 Tax=Archangium gephyra TaxID=48 RepID=UPI0035D3DED3